LFSVFLEELDEAVGCVLGRERERERERERDMYKGLGLVL
jgi:hypothetical protein